jgi:molecular chaperone DnaJ
VTDYYAELGVSKSASQEEIKRAYKKKAKESHPDLNKEDPSAEEKFKRVNEAYKTLSDPQKRAQYDQFGHDAFTQGQRAGGQSGFEGFSGFDFSGGFGGFEDLFGDIFGFSRQRTRRGQDLQVEVTITLKEAYEGGERTITLNKHDPCEACKGTGAHNAELTTCSQCGGTGQTLRQQQTPFGVFQAQTRCAQCGGAGRTAKRVCADCGGSARKRRRKEVTIDLPAGIADGQRLRVAGEGEAGPAGTPPGDLYLFVRVKEHPLFTREDDDLQCEIPISITQAVFGDDVQIPTLDGEVTLNIPAGTQSHTRFRVRNYGMPGLHGGKGDLYVRVKVQTPKKVSKEQREALKRFQQASGEDTKPQRSFFDRLRDAF